MPTYEYRCQACSHEFEQIQRMTDDPLGECPECKGLLKRLIGAGAGIIFKGSGFYETDYRSDKYKKDAAKEKPTSSDTSSSPKTSEPKSSTSSEKPAATSS